MTKIRKRRMSLSLSQSQFARAINANPANASRLETGTYKAGRAIMDRVASALGLGADELFDSDGWPLEVPSV